MGFCWIEEVIRIEVIGDQPKPQLIAHTLGSLRKPGSSTRTIVGRGDLRRGAMTTACVCSLLGIGEAQMRERTMMRIMTSTAMLITAMTQYMQRPPDFWWS